MKNFQRIWKDDHPSKKEIRSTILHLIEQRSTRETTERVVKILDSKYERANLEIVANAKNLEKGQKKMLLKLLKQYKTLFDGTLGRWNTTPVNIEL